MNFHDFHFLRPLWLLIIPAGLLLSYYLWRQTDSMGDWRKACDAHLLPHLISGEAASAKSWPFAALALIWIIAACAMAGPAWERIEQPLFRQLAPRVIVLDLSRSMDAADLKPSRLTRAKFKLADLLKASKDGQHAMVVFAGDAFVVYPLTDDINTLLNLLPALNTEVVPVQGGRASRGLELAMELLDNAGAFGDIILITDGVDSEANNVAKTIKRSGHVLYVLAAGTEAGAPIKMAGGGFLKDAGGGIVLPAVDFSALTALATTGGGRAVSLTNDQTDIEILKSESMLRSLTQQSEETNYFGDLWRDAGVWLVLLLLPFAALAFRRGWLWTCAWMVLLVPVMNPQPAQAAEWWDSLWQRPDQRAATAMQQRDFERAAELSDDPLQRGSALFRMDQFDAAANAFNEVTNEVAGEDKTATATVNENIGAIAHYNRGNALAQQWQFDEALAAYEKALKLNPRFEDALHNREVVKRALEKQPQEEGQGGEQPEDGERAENNDEKNNPGQTEPQDSSSQSQQQQSENAERNQQSEQDSQEQAEQDVQQSASQDQNQDDMKESEQAEQSQQGEQNIAEQPDQEISPESDSIAMAERESQDAIEQWLRRIPDDPGGLLRRKFLLQYKRRGEAPPQAAQTW